MPNINNKFKGSAGVHPSDLRIVKSESVRFIRIDVGLSDDASHSVECLMDHDDRLIIGVEPHPENIRKFVGGASKFHSISLLDKVVRKGYLVKRVENLESKFIIIEGAAGSSAEPRSRKFNSAYPDRGNSSFYNIHSMEFTGNITDRSLNVIEFPLEMVFNEVEKAGFEFIESLKIDTEGHELEVLKGAAHKISKVLYCRIECFKGFNSNVQHANQKMLPKHIKLSKSGYADSATEISDYLEKYNFQLIASRPGDYIFLNMDLKHLLSEYELYP